MEKKQIKISLYTFIVSIIMLMLLVVIVVMGIYIANQNKTIEESKVIKANMEEEFQQEIVEQNNKVKSNTNNAQSISKEDLYGVYYWNKDYNNESGLNLKVTLVLNSDGSAQYSVSDGYEYESTKGIFSYQDGKILYTRQYYNYDNNDNTKYTDINNSVETFTVVDKNTLQNIYHNEKASLTKTTNQKLTSSTLGEKDVLYILSATNNNDGNYTLNGVLYKHDNENYNQTEISDRWILTNKYYTITVSKDLSCNMKYDYDDKYHTVADVFNNYKDVNPENTPNPNYTHCFKFIFENNICTHIENILTGGI